MILVELMGLPGAGKSTVYEGLLAERVETIPILRRRPYALGLARHLAGTVATLAGRRALSRRWSRRLIIMMAYLKALPPVLDRFPPDRVLVFDQGPVYTLMREPLRDERLRSWWEQTFADWRARLDVVVWLDAPSTVLAERIDARAEPHRLKGVGPAAALEGLAADRAVYEHVLSRLEAGDGGPRVLRFDTSRQAPPEIIAAVLAGARAP